MKIKRNDLRTIAKLAKREGGRVKQEVLTYDRNDTSVHSIYHKDDVTEMFDPAGHPDSINIKPNDTIDVMVSLVSGFGSDTFSEIQDNLICIFQNGALQEVRLTGLTGNAIWSREDDDIIPADAIINKKEPVRIKHEMTKAAFNRFTLIMDNGIHNEQGICHHCGRSAESGLTVIYTDGAYCSTNANDWDGEGAMDIMVGPECKKHYLTGKTITGRTNG